jgi:alpha-L-rhamnosidase
MNSFNHYSLGSVGEWLYEYVAGIRSDPARPAYRHVLVAPVPGELEFARATYASVRGPITSAWRRTRDALHLDVEIPANVTATVVLPGHGMLTESGRDAADAEGVHAVRREAAAVAAEIGSGRYSFAIARHQTGRAADPRPGVPALPTA